MRAEVDIPWVVRESVRHERTGLMVSDRGASFVAAIQRLAADVEIRDRLASAAREHAQQCKLIDSRYRAWEKRSFSGNLSVEARYSTKIAFLELGSRAHSRRVWCWPR